MNESSVGNVEVTLSCRFVLVFPSSRQRLLVSLNLEAAFFELTVSERLQSAVAPIEKTRQSAGLAGVLEFIWL